MFSLILDAAEPNLLSWTVPSCRKLTASRRIYKKIHSANYARLHSLWGIWKNTEAGSRNRFLATGANYVWPVVNIVVKQWGCALNQERRESTIPIIVVPHNHR